VPHRLGHAAVDHVGEEAVAVRGHGDQVAPLARGGGEDLVGRVAAAEERLRVEPVGGELGAHLLEVGAVAAHLLALL
jgi:hypothetical protein